MHPSRCKFFRAKFLNEMQALLPSAVDVSVISKSTIYSLLFEIVDSPEISIYGLVKRLMTEIDWLRGSRAKDFLASIGSSDTPIDLEQVLEAWCLGLAKIFSDPHLGL